MRHANAMIDYLMNCDDEALLDDIIRAIVQGDYFDDERIEAAESNVSATFEFIEGDAEWLESEVQDEAVSEA